MTRGQETTGHILEREVKGGCLWGPGRSQAGLSSQVCVSPWACISRQSQRAHLHALDDSNQGNIFNLT